LRVRRSGGGAWSVAVSGSAVVCSVVSWLRSTAPGMLNVESFLRFRQVASIGAQLRSAPVSRTVVASRSQVNVALE
jgi:hypothetical protein